MKTDSEIIKDLGLYNITIGTNHDLNKITVEFNQTLCTNGRVGINSSQMLTHRFLVDNVKDVPGEIAKRAAAYKTLSESFI